MCRQNPESEYSWILPVFGKNKWENNLYIGNFLRSIDISSSDKLDVRAIVNVIFINKTISIVKVPTRLRSLTGD